LVTLMAARLALVGPASPDLGKNLGRTELVADRATGKPRVRGWTALGDESAQALVIAVAAAEGLTYAETAGSSTSPRTPSRSGRDEEALTARVVVAPGRDVQRLGDHRDRSSGDRCSGADGLLLGSSTGRISRTRWNCIGRLRSQR
jgi:hypothetical protein